MVMNVMIFMFFLLVIASSEVLLSMPVVVDGIERDLKLLRGETTGVEIGFS